MKIRSTILIALLMHMLTAFSGELASEYEAVMEVYRADDYVKAKELALPFLEKAKAENDAYYLSKTYYLLGYICSHTDDFGNAVIYYLEGARHAELSGREDLKPDLISMYKNLGSILGKYHHFDLSNKFINEGLRVASALNDEKQIISLLNNRIYQYIEEERYQEALMQIDSLLKNFKVSKERYLMLQNKAGATYKELGNEYRAREIFESLVAEDSTISPTTYAYALENLGRINLEKGRYSESLNYLLSAYANNKQRKDNRMLFDVVELIGHSYYQLKEYDKALSYYQEALELVKKGDQQPYFYEVYKEISLVYTALDDYPKALEYERIYSEELEKFIEQQRKIEELDKKYNIQLLTERYFDLLAANEEQKATERNAKIGISGTVVLFLLIISFIYYRQLRTRQSIRRKILEIDFNSEV